MNHKDIKFELLG